METWFSRSIDQPFVAFSFMHFTMLAIFILGIVLITLLHKKQLIKPRGLEVIRWTLLAVLLLSELSYQFWAITNETWSIRDRAPLHLCGIASFTAMLALIFKKEKLIQLCFFIGIIPATLALVTPDIPHDYQHFRFWKFFIHHIAIVWTSIFLVLTTKTSIHLRSFIYAYGFLVFYAIIIGFFVNPVINSNFLYLANTPAASTPLAFFGTGFWYYINLGIVANIVFFIQYLAFRYWNSRKG
ncbi:TIGR02206 family membrane protein [Aquibacillus koreensis]|uniref:TIGR02206 family membrane protein n=1 Tax=Aquibacillus koreensis TaxID=279446 RepID=A0A9X4AI56_9BACI|nr:TIGR02206 family membrane protein [Aquibacillus koreensis]MCT2538255.1 TIGR02206 family membrane protein [Aquibacillus koreensis]MDC3420802.1 TIGR02206 family membrane protein [Aquibacillus koreensis]